MKINAKIRYAARVLLELALHSDNEGLYQKDISRNQDISFKYLDQIIAGLKTSGLIATVAGKKSGYRLNRHPGSITILDIFNAFNPEFAIVDSLNDNHTFTENRKCATMEFWKELNATLILQLKSVTVEDLAKRQAELDQNNQEIIFHI
jgi:Rrf2 family protein